MAGGWRYYLEGPDGADEGVAGVVRIQDGAPLITAETATASGTWRPSDALWRAAYLESGTPVLHEVDADRARAALALRVERGTADAAPDLQAPPPPGADIRAPVLPPPSRGPRWRFFLTEPDRLMDGFTMVFRMLEGAPLLTLEMAGAVWATTDRMWRAHYLGSMDDDFHEVAPEEAAAVLRRYLAIGWFPRIPDLDAPGPDEALIAAARGYDERGDAAWRDVRTPPGADNLDL